MDQYGTFNVTMRGFFNENPIVLIGQDSDSGIYLQGTFEFEFLYIAPHGIVSCQHPRAYELEGGTFSKNNFRN